MGIGFRDVIGFHAEALMLRERRNELLTSNIANAATPHFKARDFDFETALAAATRKDGMLRSDARHLSAQAGAENPGWRVPVNPSLDGNTVELGVEQMEFAENTLRYQTSLQLLNRRISGLMTAIKGE